MPGNAVKHYTTAGTARAAHSLIRGNPHARRSAIRTNDMTSISFSDIALTGCFTDSSEQGEDQDAATASPGETLALGISLYDTRVSPWTLLQTVATPNPSWLVCHPTLAVVYAVNEVDMHDDQATGALQVYRLERDQADRPGLTHLATRALAPGATGPTHVAIDPQGRHLVVSCYNGGQFNVFALDAQGLPGEVAHAERPVGHGLDPDRQEAPHAHHASCDPSGKYWLTCDLGRDRVTLMTLDGSRLVRTADVTMVPGAGARHAVFHPTLPWIYVVTEMHATLVRLTYDAASGRLHYPDAGHDIHTDANRGTSDQDAMLDEPLFDGQLFEGQLFEGGLLSLDPAWTDVSLLPDGYCGEKSGSALVMHPSGRWLYASTRRTDSTHPSADSVSAWAIDPASGTLTLVDRYVTGLDVPRAIALSPQGDTLYALNQKGGSIIAMAVDADTGALGAPEVVTTTQQPTCLVWMPQLAEAS